MKIACIESTLMSPIYNFPVEFPDIIRRLDKLKSHYFCRDDPILTKKFQELKPIDLSVVLRDFFIKMILEGPNGSSFKDFKRIASFIPLKQLQEISEIKCDFQEIKGMLEEAKLYLSTIKRKISPSIQIYLLRMLDAICLLIENFITSIGLGSFFKSSDNEAIAQAKAYRITVLLNIFTLAATTLIPLLGASQGALAVVSGIFGLTLLSAVWPLIKPMASQLPANAENWTNEILNGHLFVEGRKESLDQIASTLKINRHVMLIGPSRVGKSLTAKAFAQSIIKGDYPEFKGYQVFRINTADLVDQKASYFGGGDSVLNEISLAMGRHRNAIILVLDEIHMACKKSEKIADQLKLFLEEGGNFPHVIAITTEEEYETFIKNNVPFSLRFDRIDIKNTCEEETLKILNDTLLNSSFKPLIEEDIIEYIYAKSQEKKENPQPASALKILKQCIQRTEKTQKTLTEEKALKISNKILLLKSQLAVSRGQLKHGKIKIKELEAEFSKLQKSIKEEQKAIKKLFESKEFLDSATVEFYQTIVKTATAIQNSFNLKNENQLKYILILYKFLNFIENYIKLRSQELGVKMVIDKALVEMTVAEI